MIAVVTMKDLRHVYLTLNLKSLKLGLWFFLMVHGTQDSVSMSENQERIGWKDNIIY